MPAYTPSPEISGAVQAESITRPRETAAGLLPTWVSDALAIGEIETVGGRAVIRTNGVQIVCAANDWILKTETGELLRCSQDIFSEIYTPEV